jgi:hypothetical protein
MVSARPHLFLGVALFAASCALMLAFAATSRAEDATVAADAGTATATDDAGAAPTPTVDGSPVADGTSGSTADPPPTDTVPPPTDTVPPPTDTVPPPTDTVPPPTDTVPPPTDSGLEPGLPITQPHDGVPGPSPDGSPVVPPPVSDALVAIVFGSPDSAPPVNDPSGRSSGVTSGVTTAPGHSRGAPGKPSLPSDSPGPSAPSAPAGSGGAPGGGFFFSGFAALVAAVCFGLAGRSSRRLIPSVVAWQPVAFVSLPERPG